MPYCPTHRMKHNCTDTFFNHSDSTENDKRIATAQGSQILSFSVSGQLVNGSPTTLNPIFEHQTGSRIPLKPIIKSKVHLKIAGHTLNIAMLLLRQSNERRHAKSNAPSCIKKKFDSLGPFAIMRCKPQRFRYALYRKIYVNEGNSERLRMPKDRFLGINCATRLLMIRRWVKVINP